MRPAAPQLHFKRVAYVWCVCSGHFLFLFASFQLIKRKFHHTDHHANCISSTYYRSLVFCHCSLRLRYWRVILAKLIRCRDISDGRWWVCQKTVTKFVRSPHLERSCLVFLYTSWFDWGKSAIGLMANNPCISKM